ncbi:MAG: recombinase family protein, partial [Candidatus Sungbacteria bacterium]|nr:recombinase family protein [Candidatus Sungbacteria bacterium]
TAKEPGRMKFAEMLSFLEQGKAEGILSWNPDRLARNSIDGGQIIYLLDTGKIKDLKFPTHWFENTPQGKFMLNIAFGQSKYYVDNLSENIKRGHRAKLRKGIWPSFAPLGYTNNHKTRDVDMDLEKAPLVRKGFELYATGKYTLKQIARALKDLGLRSYKGNVLAVSCVQRILKSTFYYGIFEFNGETYQGSHEPLISKKLFDTCQEVMKDRGHIKTRKAENTFPFRGLLTCGECKCAITAETQKGHNYYRCTKKREMCSQKYVREELLTEQVKSFLQKVSLSSQDTEKVLHELNKDEQKAKEDSKVLVGSLKNDLADIETKLDKLLSVYLDEVITSEEYAAQKQKMLCRAKTKNARPQSRAEREN